MMNSRAQHLLLPVLLLFPLIAGCAAFRPIHGIPARYMPDEFRGSSRSGKETIDLSLLRQSPPAMHLVDTNDLLSIYIEGILGKRTEQPPVHFPLSPDIPPTVGFPIPVRDDGTISLPLVGSVMVRGLSIRGVEETLRRAYTADKKFLNEGSDRIFVSLQQPRTHRILVIRQEASSDVSIGSQGQLNIGSLKRGTGKVVNLPVYKNDVLNALAETGGLPGLDAENAIYIIRSRERVQPAAYPATVPTPIPQRAPQAAPGSAHRLDAVIRSQSPDQVNPNADYRSTGQTGWSQPQFSNPYGAAYAGRVMPVQAQVPLPPSPSIAPFPPAANINPAPQGSAPVYAPPMMNSAPLPGQIPQGGPVYVPGQNAYGGFPNTNPYQPPYQAQPAAPDQGLQPSPYLPGPALAPQDYPQIPPAGDYGWSAPPQGELPHGWSAPVVPEADVVGDWPTQIGPHLNDRRMIRIPVRLGPGEYTDIREEDIILHDGDIVFIESRETEVFYTGGLLGGGQYTLPRDYDLDALGAIAVAQGQRSGGGSSRATQSQGGQSALNADVSISASQLIVLRPLGDGTQLTIQVDLYEAIRNPNERIIIQPGDYLILQYTRGEAVMAFIERHLLEGALFGVAAAQLNSR